MLHYSPVPTSTPQNPPVMPPDQTGLCCQDEARSEGGAAVVYWRQLSRTLQHWEAACGGQGQKSSSKQLLASGHQRAPDDGGHGLLVRGSAPHSVTVCMEGITFMLGMKRCIYFPITHCPVGARYEGVICTFTLILKATVPWIFVCNVSGMPKEDLQFLCLCTFGGCWCGWQMKNLMYEETRITCFQTSIKFMAFAGRESTVASHYAKGRQGSLLIGSSGIWGSICVALLF